MLRLLAYLARAAFVTAIARLRRGPRRPSWTFGFEATVAAMRAEMAWLSRLPVPRQRAVAAKLAGRSPELARVAFEEARLDGVAVVRCRPRELGSRRVVLYLHGGGFVFGSTRQDAALVATLAVACDAEVVGVDYALAPEHPCPAATRDVVAAHAALLAEGHAPEAVAWVGLSAGGFVAAAALVDARDRDVPLPACAALLSAGGDLPSADGARRSYVENAALDLFGDVDLTANTAAYAGKLDVHDPRVAPIRADLRGLPPLLVQTGECEMLRDACVAFGDAARAAGVSVEMQVYEDMVHAFQTLRGPPQVQRAVDAIAAFVRLSCSST